MGKQPRGKLSFIYVSVLICSGDWLTKYMIHQHFNYGESREIIRGLFSLVYVKNFGSAFGFMNKGQETSFNTLFFAAASLIGILLLSYLIKEERRENTLGLFSLFMLLGGIFGNQGERFYHGFVTDFLDIYLGNYHWPAFNVADSAITVGIVLYFISSYILNREKV